MQRNISSRISSFLQFLIFNCIPYFSEEKNCGFYSRAVSIQGRLLFFLYCLGEGQPTKEARVLLEEANGSIEFIPRPTLNDVMYDQNEVYEVDNGDDLTDNIIEEFEIEITS